MEASYNGGAWADIGAVFYPDGTLRGTLPGQTTGQGALMVRQANAPSATPSVLLAGAGSRSPVKGQSNPGGRLTNMQAYSHATLKASVFRENSTVPEELADPTDSDVAFG